ncbi:cytochrome P450 [Periconia macrospinosa]|uniref:Cytochrome P450 n=1 Tax=Periconia macrospinosa TaxID=97972 RepID=A0A2V1E576_9PLEO|nr:cytochrome P450 [Periconia macrospinosa]
MTPSPIQVLFFSLTEAVVGFYLFPGIFPKGSLASFLIFFSSLNFTAYFGYVCYIYPYFRSPLRHLPQPPPARWPLIQHGSMLFERTKGEAFLTMMKETEDHGLIYFRSFFNAARVLVTDPAALGEVLVNRSYDFEKPMWARQFLRQFLGDGLLITEGDEHKHQRKHIMPAFSFRHIKELYPVFCAKSFELCKVIKTELAESKDNVLEIGHYSTQVTMDIIGLAGLGRDVGSLRNSDDELIKNYEELLQPTNEKAIYFILHIIFPQWLIQALPWKLNHRIKVITSSLKRICQDFVVEKKSRMKVETEESRDILGIMLRSNNFSDDNAVDQLLTFLAAGHETTTSAFTWATHLLAIHPTSQSRLRAEIFAAIPSPSTLLSPTSTSSPDFHDSATLLESLPYLNAICNEVLRLYPTVPITARTSVRDTQILGQFIPRGTLVQIVPWAINRNPKLWGADAETFNPDRWIDAASGKATMNGGAMSNYAFLTFLHGPRSCIGERFARAELRALLAAMVGCFKWEMADPNEKIIIGGTITSKPVQGMKLKLVPIEWGEKVMAEK